MNLVFNVEENNIVCTTPDVSRTQEVISYVKCRFLFKSGNWANMDAIVAMFKSASYDLTAECVLDSNGCCYMPPEIYKHGGVIQVIIYGDQWTLENTRWVSDYIGPANVFFGQNVVLPVPLPSKYDVFVAEFSNIKHGLDESSATMQELIDNFNDIETAYLNEEYYLVIEFSNGDTYISAESLKGPQGDPREYADLPDKPSIEGVTLQGDKSFEDLGLKSATAAQITAILSS